MNIFLYLRFVFFSAVVMFLVGCSPTVQDYQGQEPAFDVAEFFSGDLNAYGVVQNYSGEVTRRFQASIKGRWQGSQGVLDEHFVFDDGEEQWRCWRLRLDGDRLTGEAGDVVGSAEGRVSGNTLNWQYVLKIQTDDGESIHVYLDDWLYLVTEDHVINRTSMTKWGLPVGEVTLAIQKTNPDSTVATRKNCRLVM